MIVEIAMKLTPITAITDEAMSMSTRNICDKLDIN